MRVEDVIKRKGTDVVVVPPTATVAEVVNLLDERRIGSVVVVEDDRLVGIISEREVVHLVAQAEGDIKGLTARDIMNTEVRVCAVEDDTADLAATMTEHRIRHLPVVNADGHLLAIVSIGDVVKARLESLADERDHLINYVRQ